MTRPTPRTLICCEPCSMKLPPTLALLLVSCCSTLSQAQAIGDQLLRVDANLIFASYVRRTMNRRPHPGTDRMYLLITQSCRDFKSIKSYAGFVLFSVYQ